MDNKRKARTIKEIKGNMIETIPVGTEFFVVYEITNRFYATCEGLGVNSVYLNEFEYTDLP